MATSAPTPETHPSDGPPNREAPTVSVLMPVYNAERFVGEAVESILGQTFGDFEFLIVDDGSTDGSLPILERFAASDPRIRLVSRPNTGYLVALNQMLEMARGEFIARMDADDVAMPTRLERQVSYLQNHSEYVMVGSWVTIIDPDGCPLKVMEVPQDHEDLDRGMMASQGQIIYHPAVVIRRGAIEKVGNYQQAYYYSEDLDLFLKLAEVGRIANLAEPLLSYREHLGKVGHTRVAQQDAASRGALLAAYERRGLEPPSQILAFTGRSEDPRSKRMTWGWWALYSGHLATARKHAWASLMQSPLSLDSWRLLWCVIRGH